MFYPDAVAALAADAQDWSLIVQLVACKG